MMVGMKLSRTETVGIGVSILVMGGVLIWLQSGTEVSQPDVAQTRDDAVVVDETDANQNAAFADAVIQAAPNAQLQNLVIDDVAVGEGPAVEVGDVVSVHYIGRLQNGQEFDNSYERGMPFEFKVGSGTVIEGWERGILGMQQGGQRILVIPADLGYGATGAGPIPGGATLVFAIELLEIR